MADWQLIEEGLKRGYSLDEVTDIIAKEEGVDPSYARERGFDSPAILVRLGYVKPEEVKPEKGFIGNVLDQAAHGVKTAYQGLLSAPGIYAGNPDAERIAGTIQAEQSHEKPKEMREAEAAFAGVSKRQSDFESVYGKDSGYMDSIGKIMDMLVTTGKEIVTNPKGMAYEMASQSGNMVAPMVGAYAGGKTGAVTGALLGPKGAVAGGVVGAGAGGFAGSHVMEQSGEFRGKVAERLSELGLEPTAENVSAIFQDKAWLDKTLEETRDKATGTAVTDGVLAAIGGLAVNAPIRAAQKTARAQLGATATAKQVSDAAADILASQPKWQKVAPHLKAGAIGWGGEPISEATGQQYGYGHVDYGDVGMEAFAAAGEGIGSVYAAAKGMRTKPTLPANVTPPPSITSASSTDDAIKAFKDEVETVSPVPRGSFSGMDDLAGLIESERSDLGKRRGLLAQQQQEARDMEAEFSGLVKDEQIDQSYRLNDAQKQRDAERTREGGYDLALQQREEQQGRTVEQLAAASEAQGFGNEEPTAMQLAMQQAQQKALDNEFSGLLKQERASLNEMRANVKRVAGVPVEQISTPQLEEIAQSEAHPNTKMAAVAALNDRHDAIQQERERLMQLRETRLEKQSNQPEQGEQHGAESHGTDGQVATPSVAGGGANVSGGGFDAAMVAADRGMRETASAGAAVSSGGQVGAVPVADQPTNVRALTENGKPSASWVIRNKETGESLFETFDRKKVDALNTEKYEAVPILEYLQSLNKPRAESPNDAQIVNVRQHTTRRKPASNTIAQAIINLGGISTSLKTDILGDASIKTRPGLFTTNGTGDLGEIAAMLSSGFGFSQIDLNDPTDNSGAKQLADLIARSVNGETILNEEGMILAQQDEEFEQAKAEVNLQAQEIGIKPIRGKRTIDIVQSEINAILAEREEMSRQKKKAQLLLDEVAEQELIEAFDLAMQEYHDETAISRDESRVESARLSAEESAQGDGDSVNQASPVAGRASPTEGGRGEAEVTPEFGLVGQTEAEARAEQGRLNQPEGLTKEQIDREATAPFSLHSDVMPPSEGPSGETSSMFTPDGRATRQAANISDDHANIPNMDGVRAAAQQILDAIEQDDLADYGLRVIPGEFEGDIAVGDVLPPSRVWEDGRETDDELLGTSTVEVGSLTLDGVLKSLNGLGAAGKPGPNGYYFGDRVVLVKGDRVSGGDDSGESLLKNASVVGVWRKASKGLSSILPNEAVAPKESGANTLDPIAAVKATLDAAGVTGTDRTSTIAAVRRGDLTPEDVAEAHPSPNVADSASEGKPIRPYATPDERNEAIWTLQAEAKSSGLEYSNESIKDAAEFGAPANEIAAAIDAGEDAVADLAERYAKRSNGLRQGFGQGNNDNALRENMKPPSEHEKRIASLTGRGLYELTEAQRSSLLKFAKVRSIDAFEDIAFSARREIIGQWLDMNPAETKQSATYTIAEHSETIDAAEKVAAAESTPTAPIARKPLNADAEAIAKADADLESALGDLGDIIGQNFRMNFTPEQEQKIIPVLTRLFDAAFRKGYYTFKDAARFVLDTIKAKFGGDIEEQITLDHLQGAYIGMAGRYRDQGADSARVVVAVENKKELEVVHGNDQHRGSNLERDSQDANVADGMGEEGVRNERGGNRGGRGSGIQDSQGEGGSRGGVSVSGREAVSSGERGDLEIYTGAPGVPASTAGNGVSVGSDSDSFNGSPIESDSASVIEEVAESGLSVEKAKLTQLQADKKEHAPGLNNIRETLPILTEGQQEDVYIAETRFAKPDGYGMLFTNGTGTGKTFTGLGVIKRFVTNGKDNIIVVVPNDKILSDWQKAGKLLGLNLSQLANTQSAGSGVVITTYANFGQNNQLAHRNWDLIVHDEAHYLKMDAKGSDTLALKALQAISLHPDGAHVRHSMLYADDIAKMADIQARLKDNSPTASEMAAIDVENDRLVDALNAARKRHTETVQAVRDDVAARQGEARPRALFLSATPFAYEKAVDWANGYLFDYNEGMPQDGASGTGGRGYNSGSNRERFFMQHFGYRMRYNKLTQPDAKVDSGLMQRQFNSWLKKSGVLSGRMLDVKADYDRRFVLVESAIGQRIDEALQWFDDQSKSGNKNPGLRDLRGTIAENFSYLQRRYLLEAIKAKEVIPHVKEHLALGRKVVVFHDYKKGGGFNPFNVMHKSGDGTAEYNAAVDMFRAEFKDLIASPVWQSSSPIATFQQEFPGVLLFNGDVPSKQRRANVEKFQDDASGPQVILVQSAAGKEGISLHDTTGKHQRVLFNLGQPTQPTTAMQQEGRIYRTGQKSDAIFRYLNTGTNWEKWAFATTIAQRASAAENLGMGEQARALKDAFIAGFEESDNYRAGMENEGKGGKERDKAANNALTEYDRAKAFYFGTQKKNSKTKSQEGTDYFATPEPVGLKMMELADIRAGESVLEPSAGHGAIARWAPDTAEKTAIEPSMTLRPRLAMVFDGKILGQTFEDLHVSNKYDAIVMNPPFGSGGRTAIDHLAKAATHLREGGRIVALIPRGPEADAKFDKWMYETQEKPSKPMVTHPELGAIYKGDTVKTNASFMPEGIVSGVDASGGRPVLMVKKPGTNSSSMIPYKAIKSIEPTGKRTESFRPSKGINLVANIELPKVTFERAGTKVATRIVVLEKNENAPQQTNRDYSNVTDIGDLFDRMENLSIPGRAKPVEAERNVAVTGGRKSVIEKANADAKAAEEKAQEAGAIAADASEATFTLSGDKIVTNAPATEYTTKAGKKLDGVLVPDEKMAKAVDQFTWKIRGEGKWFVRLRHIERPGVAMFSRGRGNLRSRPRGEITHETQRLEKGINRDLSRQGKEAIWATGFITRSAVPDNARRLVAAVEKLFGVRVEFVQVGDERANIFNGVFLGGNTLFVNVDSSSPVSTVIGHEFLHFLKESNPDLYAKAESVLLALANAKKFAAAATKHQPAMNAGEEVIADTFGDQFSNPEFWEEMANRVEPSLFMRIRAAFTRFMGKLLGEIKAMGTTNKTDALYSDLDAVRDAVLSATVGAAKGRKLATPSWSNLHARFMTAWHGSPHDHDGFDSSNIGTGEGAQAYGWGHYFAGSREVAEWYRKKLASNELWSSRFTRDGETLNGREALREYFKPGRRINGYAGIDEVIAFNEGKNFNWSVKVKSVEDQFGNEPDIWDAKPRVHATEPKASEVDKVLAKDGWKRHAGRLYQVDLKPAADEYLDWDKPLSEQSEKVREALTRAGVIVDGKYGDGFGATPMFPGWSTFTGESIHRRIVNREFEKQREVTAAARKIAEQAASKYLHSIGIRGIRYLDGSSRSAGDGNSNYVIFDDADVKITAKESRRASNETAPANAGVSVSAPSESVRRIQAVVERFKSQFKGTSALDIRVVSTTFDIPARFRPSPFAEGVFHDDAGLVYLVTMNLRNPRGVLSENRAWQVLLHESVGHYGLSQMMGDKFASILKAVKQATLAGRKVSETQSNPLQPGDKDYTTWEAVKLRYPKASDAEVAQEVLARMSETDPGSSIVGYAVATVRQWVRDVARAMGVNVVVSTSELRDLVAKASGYMRRGDNLAEERVPSGLVAASQKVGAGETAFNLVDVTSAAFKKWFGDSKVVDAGGNPLRVYHGTDADLTEFKRVDSRTGHPSAQLGVFFTASAKVADRFNRVKTDLPFSDIGKLDFAEGANQLPVYLSIKNPAVLSAKEFRDLMVDLGSPPDKVYGWMRTPEGWAALRDHFINAEGRDGVKILAERNVYSGSGLEEYAADQYVAFNPTQIKSAISNTGAFDSTNPSILESRAAQGKPQGPIWSAPEMSRTDNIIYTMQDKNIDLKRVQQAIKSAVGEIRDDIDAYLQEELFHGRAAKITEEFLDKEVNPLISIMRASNVSMDEMETFLWARHAKERNAQIAKINEAMPDGGSGLTNKQADDLMAGKDVTIGDKTIEGVKPNRKELLSNLAGRVDAITRGNRALLEHYSLESADTLNAWDGAYKHYVPLHREDADSHLAGMGTGMGYSVKGASSKRATGSSRPVENILANLALQRERIITRGEKNRVAQSLYGLAKEMPNADLWEVDVKPTMRTTAMVEGREQVVDAVDPNFRNRPNVVFARFNGKDRFIVFNEHNERAVRMAQALKNLDADDISHLLGEVSRWTRYFASINTQYNPIFGVTNLVRDVQTGLLNLKSTPIEGKQKELMGNLTHALPAVFKALRADRKGQAATGSWAQLWEEFQEVGGQTGYRDMFRNGQERAEALQNALDPTWWQKTWWGKAATVGGVLAVPEQAFLDKVGKPLKELLSDYNTMMENGIRLAAYKVALDTGMTQARAASLAKNLTVNFNRKGQAARQVGAMYAFFNASIQGTARMAETLNHGAKPGELLGKAGKQIVYGGLLLGAVQAMLLMAAGFDDEEPPEFVRDRNIIIPTGNGKYVSIPMPLGFHVLPAISRISIEFTAGGFKKPGEHLVHIMDVLLDSFNPIGNAGLSMQTVAPTVLDPIAALTENKDWSGRQIARQDFSKLNPTPGYTRAKDTASSLSRGLAYAFNYLSGGGEYGIGIVSPTPDQIDYLLGQLTGGVGREVGKVLTTGETMATGEDLPPHKIPLVGRFYGDTTGQSSEASKFYGTLEKLSEHRGTLDRMKDAHDLEAYREYAKEHPESRFYDRANKVQRELSSLRKLKRKMIERNADRAKVRQIEDRMRTLMTRFNQSVSEQKGDH